MIAVNHILWGDALLAGTHRDGHTVLVTTADKHDILLLQAQIAHIDVSWDIDTSQVTNVHTTISVWQR